MKEMFSMKRTTRLIALLISTIMVFTGTVTAIGAENTATPAPNGYSSILLGGETEYELNQNSTRIISLSYSYGLSKCVIADGSIAKIEHIDYDEDEVKIRGLREGQTTATITTTGGSKVVCTIKVKSCFTSLEDEYVLSVGESKELMASAYMENYKWSSSDPSVVTVDEPSSSYSYKTKIKGIAPGTATITVTNEFGESKQINVTVKTLALKLENKDGYVINKLAEKKGYYEIVYLSYGNTSLANCTVDISDESIVSIEDRGAIGKRAYMYVRCLKPGNATITITNQYGESATLEVQSYDIITGIIFNEPKVSVYMGQQTSIGYTVNPSEANNTMVHSYNTDALDISEDGVVTPKKAGTYTVTVYGKESKDYSSYSYVQGKCTVEIKNPYFDKTSISLYKKHSTKIKLTGGRADTKWSSSNTKVATVDKSGNVVAVAVGKAKISANTGGYVVTANVTVNKPKLSATSTKLYRNKKTTLKVTGGKGTIKWSSSNSKVASVSSKGVVTAKKVGSATIKATVSGETLTCKVTVKAPEISAKSKTLYAGNTYTLKMNGAVGKTKWKSSNTKVVKVSSSGKLTAVKKGSATITAKVDGKTYKCKVKVNANQKTFKVNKDVYDYDYGAPEIVMSKVYVSGGKLKLDIYVMNNRIFKATKFSWLKYELYDYNDKLIASQKFKNIKLNIGPRKYKKITLTFSNSAFKNKNVILNKGVYDDWEYYYNYNY